MRNRVILATAALLLASLPGTARAQQPASTTSTASGLPWKGLFDVGGAFGSTDGDEARYERYRDTRNGVYSDIRLSHLGPRYEVEVFGTHLGYRDQRIGFGLDSRKVKFHFLFDSIPTNYMYDAFSPWQRGSSTLTLNDDPQRDVQNKVAVGVPCAPGSGPTSCNYATAAQALANRSIYNNPMSGTTTFDMRTKRETAGFDVAFAASSALDLTAKFQSTSKEGDQPWGASFAFNNANELPLPVKQRTNDFGAGLEYSKPRGMVRVAWDGSWFTNDNQVLVWDNPIRLTDYNSGNPSIPWDANGYSNGNGPAQGRMAIFPSNSMNVLSTTGLYKLARATSVNGTLQFMSQDQDQELIPWTINSVINQAAPSNGFPHLASLPRNTADASASGLNALINFSSRPFPYLGVQAKYRYNKRDVKTEEFDAKEWVRFDAVPEEAEESFSEQFDVTRKNFDAAATLSLLGYGSFKVGYAHEAYEREGRGFSDSSENTVRLSYDAMGLSFIAVRVGYDYGQRRGEGFYLAGQDYEQQDAGEQPGLRYYDEADRNRTRASIVVSANPMDTASFYFQYAHGKDEYLADDFIPAGREFFGLLDSDYNSWNVGATVNPSEKVAIGANYGQDKWSAFQKSRNANPPPDSSWTDPNRDWTMDNGDDGNNFSLWVDLTQAIQHLDIKFIYDYSDSDQNFTHGGPRIAGLAATTPPATGQFIPLPNVSNTWQRFTADLKFFFTARLGLGVGYYYEKFDVEDFATIDTSGSIFGLNPVSTTTVAQSGVPRLEYLGEIMTGYMNRPYSGYNVFVRGLYRF